MRKPIKICYILPEYNEETDSHFFHLYEFIKKLSERLDIFLIAEKGDIGRDIGRATSNIKRVYVQRFKFLPLRFLESFIAILKARILGYKNFYTHYCYIGGINAGIISRLLGGKSYYWNCAMNWLFKQRSFSKIGFNLSLKLSHYLITGSEEMKNGYAEHYGLNLDKIKVMPNWINLERFQPTADHPQGGKHQVVKNILFVHWLSKRKGADMIVPIMKHLNQAKSRSAGRGDQPSTKRSPTQRDEAINLMVVGEGPYKKELLQEIKENKLKDFIEVVGKVPNKDIMGYYQKADLFLMPSMEEGFPRVLLEAMAMGIPYVASDVGAVREISSETAQRFLVKPGDIEMFVQKIEILLSDKEIYEQFREEELEKVKEYSLEKISDKFISLLVSDTNKQR